MKFALLPILFFLVSYSYSQVLTVHNSDIVVSEKGKFNKGYKRTVYQITPPDSNVIISNDSKYKQSQFVKPLRFAEPIKLNLNVVTLAQWQQEGEVDYGIFTFQVKKAKSLSFNFNNFYLPSNTELYIYNEKGKTITGAVTGKENNKENIWGSTVYKGDVLSIEIKVPRQLKDSLKLIMSNVAYGYKEIFCKDCSAGGSGNCHTDVICPAGNSWTSERRAVAKILSENGSCWCSGALVNNTCYSYIPYVLTANHCLDGGNENVSQWRYIFGYWSTQCNVDQPNLSTYLFNGSVLKANNAATDFALLQLNSTPAANTNITYAGWTRATIHSRGVGLHHPAGDLMKISFDDQSLSKTNNSGGSGTTFWRVTWDQGVTEGGSSGSPLFNQNKLIVGQLYGGPSVCGGSDLRDYYGAFDVSWTGGGTNATRLSNWLDPNGTNATSVNTTTVGSTFPQGVTTATSNSTNFTGPLQSGVSFFMPSGQSGLATFNVTDTRYSSFSWTPISVPSGASWSTFGPGNRQLNINITASGTPYTQKTASIQLTATGTCGSSYSGSFSATAVVSSSFNFTMSPNPGSELVTLTAESTANKGGLKSDVAQRTTTNRIYQIKIYNSTGVLKKSLSYLNGVGQVKIPVTDLNPGSYMLSVFDGIQWQSKQLIIAR